MQLNLNPHILGLAEALYYNVSWSLIFCLITLCSIVAMAIFLERFWLIRSEECDLPSFFELLQRTLYKEGIVSTIAICEQQTGAVARIALAGLLKHSLGKSEVQAALERTGRVELAALEKHVRLLALIAQIAPLLGLLGTVVGLIQAFALVQLQAWSEIPAFMMGNALEYALLSTAAGLVVAIPAILAYNYLVYRIEEIALSMQLASSELISLLVAHNELSE